MSEPRLAGFGPGCRDGQAQGRAPPQASLGSRYPTLEISGEVHRVPYVLSMELDPLPVNRKTVLFSLTHTFRQVCH